MRWGTCFSVRPHPNRIAHNMRHEVGQPGRLRFVNRRYRFLMMNPSSLMRGWQCFTMHFSVSAEGT